MMTGFLKKALAVGMSAVIVAGSPGSPQAAAAGTEKTAVSGEERAAAGEAAGHDRIRVDLNRDDGRTNAYSPLFDNWIVKSGSFASYQTGGVTFRLSNGGSAGKGIRSGSNKRLIKADGNSPYLTLDGVTIDDAASGGTIRLEITGLSAGTHTLKTWHSFYDQVEGSTMSVTIDGTKTFAGIKSVTQAKRDEDAGMSYSRFEATEGKTVTVLIAPEGNGAFNNAVLNAFEIDGADPFETITDARPADGDLHYEYENGLSWTAGPHGVSHDVYLGTDERTVREADKNSPAYQGSQTETTFSLPRLSPLESYYWRVDEVAADGAVYKGETKKFEIARLAFPTAEGYGRYAKAGRGGRIIEVTNLNDSGPGSLRQAIEVEKGPRIVVFRVGGVIELKSRLSVPADGGNLYVAGQTAPGDGITVTKYGFGIYYASDVVIRHVRCRVGDENGVAMDGMGMAGADHSIIDHCSISWTTDEGTSSRGARNITFQHNIIAEALNNSTHYDAGDRDKTERHSFAGSISGDIGSFHHNLLVDCTGRNWSLAGGMEQDAVTYAGRLDVRNNVVYNYRDRTTDGGVKRINFVNNYYKQGPVSKNMNIFSIDGDELNTGDMQMAYLSGNKMVKSNGDVILDSDEDSWKKAGSKYSSVSKVKSDVPFFESYVKTETADEAYESVLADVGATKPKQDAFDARYIFETKNGTYTYKGSRDGLKGIIDSQEDVGGYPQLSGGEAPDDSDHDGMPDAWEVAHDLNPDDGSDGSRITLSEEGYTNVELYLNELAGDPVVYQEAPGPGESAGPEPTESESPAPAESEEPEPTETAKPKPTGTPVPVPDPGPYAAVKDMIDAGELTASDLIDMSQLTGWASVPGEGVEALNGGGDETPYLVTNLWDLWRLTEDNAPRVIIVAGTITCLNDETPITVGSNKTIVGLDENATIAGGIDVRDAQNVIVSNLNFKGSWYGIGPNDAVSVRNSHHVWLDHLNIWDARDGNMDLVMGVDYITVSWCKFWYSSTDNDHRLCSLVGSGTGHDDTDMGRLNVTYHHNWFAENIMERQPRVLYGKGHIYNNYYTSAGNSYCIAAACYASVLIENNYFFGVNDPHRFMYENALPANITARGNIYDHTTGRKDTGYGGRGTVEPFTEPPYEYRLDEAEDLPALVIAGVGPRSFDKIPVISPAPDESEEPGPGESAGPDESEAPAPVSDMGDVNRDGNVTAEDALDILKDVVKLKALTEEQKLLADTDRNGTVTANDALNVLKFVVRLIKEL